MTHERLTEINKVNAKITRLMQCKDTLTLMRKRMKEGLSVRDNYNNSISITTELTLEVREGIIDHILGCINVELEDLEGKFNLM